MTETCYWITSISLANILHFLRFNDAAYSWKRLIYSRHDFFFVITPVLNQFIVLLVNVSLKLEKSF